MHSQNYLNIGMAQNQSDHGWTGWITNYIPKANDCTKWYSGTNTYHHIYSPARERIKFALSEEKSLLATQE